MSVMFPNRQAAGRELAEYLRDYRREGDLLVLGLPRGGVPVAYEVARSLGAELDVMVVRKLGVPGQPEFAMGALASGGVRVLDESIVRALGLREEQVETVVAAEREELARRERLYRDGRPSPRIQGRTVILVDDGLATGASMKAAVRAVDAFEPARVVVAVPVAPPDATHEFSGLADAFVCVHMPWSFQAVGQFYREFGQTTDDEVRDLLARAAAAHAPEDP